MVVLEVIGGKHGHSKGSKDHVKEFGQQIQLQHSDLNLFDYGDAPPLSPSPIKPTKSLHLCSVMLRMTFLMVAMYLCELCIEVRGDN